MVLECFDSIITRLSTFGILVNCYPLPPAHQNMANFDWMRLNESYMPLGPRLHEEKYFYHL